VKILKAIDRRDLIGNYRNMERRYEPLTPAQRKARVEAYRKQFLELTAPPPAPPKPPRERNRWYYASDGRFWLGTRAAAEALGVSESHIRQAALTGWRAGEVWLAFTAERAARAERWGLRRKTREVFASDGRSWQSITKASEALGVSRRKVESRRNGEIGSSVAGVWLGATVEEARARAGAGKERAGR
jgi:hypothetical protein